MRRAAFGEDGQRTGDDGEELLVRAPLGRRDARVERPDVLLLHEGDRTSSSEGASRSKRARPKRSAFPTASLQTRQRGGAHPGLCRAALEEDLLDLSVGEDEDEGIVVGEVLERDDEGVRGVEGGCWRDRGRGEGGEEGRGLGRVARARVSCGALRAGSEARAWRQGRGRARRTDL